ncbi:MAG: hypothetical protein JXR10_04005 [Cyclobacteriaceae bacterium]
MTNNTKSNTQDSVLDSLTKEFSLIDGEFSQEEAKEILIHLLSYKIKFHNQKIFSINERFGEKDEKSMKRIYELTQTLKELKETLNALESDAVLNINSSIKISKK